MLEHAALQNVGLWLYRLAPLVLDHGTRSEPNLGVDPDEIGQLLFLVGHLLRRLTRFSLRAYAARLRISAGVFIFLIVAKSHIISGHPPPAVGTIPLRNLYGAW